MFFVKNLGWFKENINKIKIIYCIDNIKKTTAYYCVHAFTISYLQTSSQLRLAKTHYQETKWAQETIKKQQQFVL